MRKAFSMIEIVFALALAAVIGYYGIHQYLWHLKEERIQNFLNNVNAIINTAIIDPVRGYVNGTGDPCSNDNTYKNITACRAIECAKLTNVFKLYENNNVCDTNPNDSYVKNLLLTETNGAGCHLYVKPDNSDDTIFYVYIDCSSIPDSRTKNLVEQLLEDDIHKNFNIILEKTYPDATSLNNTAGGTSTDGKIMFEFKK